MIVNVKQVLHHDHKDENFWLYEEIMNSLTPEIKIRDKFNIHMEED